MKKVALAFLVAFVTMVSLGINSKIQAFAYPQLDVSDFNCQETDPTSVDMELSFTSSTVYKNASVMVVRGATVFGPISLPKDSLETIRHTWRDNLPESLYRVYYMHPSIGTIPLEQPFSPEGCNWKK